ADARQAGVGSESQIISGELYGRVQQQKFIPIIAERDGDGKPFQPVYLKSLIYIDLSQEASFAEQYESLLRNIFEKPARQRPRLGKPPAFLSEPNPASAATHFRLAEFIKAAEAGGTNAAGHLTRFFEECTASLENYRLPANPPEPIDELVLSRITEMKLLRDQ